MRGQSVELVGIEAMTMTKCALPRFAALCIAALFCLGAAPASSALPEQTAGDVAESYRLLSETAFNPVDPQTLLTAASEALSEQARKRGVTLAAPALHVQGDGDATVSQLEDAIVTTAQATHADASDLA